MVSKRWTPRNHAMGGLFVFLLLALFALTCLVTVLLSVQGYLGIQADVDQCASQRVLAGYLRGKVRSSDLAGGVALRQEELLRRLAHCSPAQQETALRLLEVYLRSL